MSELVDCINNLSAKDIIRAAAKTANGVPFYINTLSGGFCADYQTIYDSFATPPSAAVAAAQDTMWCALVDAGIAAKLDLFYLFAQSNGGDALINWSNLGNFDCLNVHATAFTALEGFTGDGANDYLNTQWDPTNNRIVFDRDTSSHGGYVRNNAQDDGFLYGTYSPATSSSASMRPRSSSNTAASWLNDNSSVGVGATADGSGMWIGNRAVNANHQIYHNGPQVGTDTDAASAISNQDMLVLCQNQVGTPAAFCSNQISVFFVGGVLSTGDITTITNAIETYMDSNGKGVI